MTMRKFKTSSFGDEVDLDDPETYKYLPDTTKDLDNRMFREIGIAICYMDYFRPEFYNPESEQRIRVMALIEDFTSKRKDNYGNLQWLREEVFMFQDETENMC